MKVRFRQSGGFVGLSRGVEVDSAEMPAREAARLEKLVEKSRLESLRPRAAAGGARDLTTYVVTIETPEGTRTATFDDSDLPESAAALLEYLQGRAKPVPPT